jgi:hypothetical protein
LTRSGYGDQYIRLCTVHETWFKGDDELWNFIHRGGDGAAGFKKLTQSEIIKVTKPKKSTQEWEVKVNFRIDPTWYEGALENNMDAAGNGVVDTKMRQKLSRKIPLVVYKLLQMCVYIRTSITVCLLWSSLFAILLFSSRNLSKYKITIDIPNVKKSIVWSCFFS